VEAAAASKTKNALKHPQRGLFRLCFAQPLCLFQYMPLISDSKKRHQIYSRTVLAGIALLISACSSAPEVGGGSAPASGGSGENLQDKTDVNFLLSMSFDEAKKMTPQNIVVSPFYKIAADEISVLKRSASGQPTRVRAKGHVFLQIDFREQLIALGQEAYIESGGEIIMRGKPLLKRGRSVVEGLSDYTVFYIKATRLQVIGSHRLAKPKGSMPVPQGGESGARSEGRMPTWNVTPDWKRSWKDGPNPILPALSPEDVPESMRASPLLPSPDGRDEPLQMPDDAPPASSKPAPAPASKPAPEAPPVPPAPPAPAPAPEAPADLPAMKLPGDEPLPIPAKSAAKAP